MDVRKAILIFAGTVCVALGVLGMFLPLLPTTVFLLMAAYCYSRSSEKFHNWLLNNRLCGAYIRNYKSGRGISMRQKVTTISILWVSIGVSIWLLGGGFWSTLLLLAVLIGVTLHLVLLKTYCAETADEKDEAVLTENSSTNRI
ncbi:MAG TPA: YbaN family protein [Pyrinomonadaceae bacterium]|nr:YbaN family protein [Pyrinomonadaceae bacterium]